MSLPNTRLDDLRYIGSPSAVKYLRCLPSAFFANSNRWSTLCWSSASVKS